MFGNEHPASCLWMLGSIYYLLGIHMLFSSCNAMTQGAIRQKSSAKNMIVVDVMLSG